MWGQCRVMRNGLRGFFGNCRAVLYLVRLRASDLN